jgi:predicted dehydrogenase
MNIQRRQFVQATAAAIATAQFPILGANDRIQVGVVGVGERGTTHLDLYDSLDSDCRIAAVCDVNQTARERAVSKVHKAKGYSPQDYNDMRKMFESKDIDLVSIATPHHWHALATIWACEAGKDVYVEKPATHNVFEGPQMVAAARKGNRMVQVGMQSRSQPYKMHAIRLLGEGVIGQVYGCRVLCFRRRFSIGHTPDELPPSGLDWDLFLGPAQWKPYSLNKYAYNWHWFWDTGNGDIGNQGVHEMDVAVWGFGRSGWPVSVSSSGGKFVWEDDQQTPNNQQTTFDFGDSQITFDVRNLPTPPEGLMAGAPLRLPEGAGTLASSSGPFSMYDQRSANYVGNVFFGDLGFLILDHTGTQVYRSSAGNLTGVRGAEAGSREKYVRTVDEKAQEEDDTLHIKNLFNAMRARDYKMLNADVAVGVRSAAYCHLANIGYRVGRTLRLSQSTGRCLGDEEANALLTRNYRNPFIVSRIE